MGVMKIFWGFLRGVGPRQEIEVPSSSIKEAAVGSSAIRDTWGRSQYQNLGAEPVHDGIDY